LKFLKRKKKRLTGTRRRVVQELVGEGIDADDAKRVAAVLANPSRKIWIRLKGLIPIAHRILLLHW
jgi:hypothetical protein